MRNRNAEGKNNKRLEKKGSRQKNRIATTIQEIGFYDVNTTDFYDFSQVRVKTPNRVPNIRKFRRK